MKDLRAVLEAADPLRDEPSLSTTEARDIRRQILAGAATPLAMTFPTALPVAALIVVMLVAGIAAGRRFAPAAPRPADDAAARMPGNGERRQVQFATPGGTRIIWTIDPNFNMRGTLP
jgi:hypothetical protein